MAPGAKAVQVMATAPTGCEKRGEVSVSVADKVALVYERNDLRVREELETLARNEAPGIGADTISPLGPPLNGDQQFAAWRSEEHTSELQSLMRISYAVFCLKKKTQRINNKTNTPPT